jgi:hypothetical protein
MQTVLLVLVYTAQRRRRRELTSNEMKRGVEDPQAIGVDSDKSRPQTWQEQRASSSKFRLHPIPQSESQSKSPIRQPHVHCRTRSGFLLLEEF